MVDVHQKGNLEAEAKVVNVRTSVKMEQTKVLVINVAVDTHRNVDFLTFLSHCHHCHWLIVDHRSSLLKKSMTIVRMIWNIFFICASYG
jgi:hypothetical protein